MLHNKYVIYFPCKYFSVLYSLVPKRYSGGLATPQYYSLRYILSTYLNFRSFSIDIFTNCLIAVYIKFYDKPKSTSISIVSAQVGGVAALKGTAL